MVFSPETLQRAYQLIAGLLFLDYGIFMVGYFFFPDFNLQYKYFIRPLHILVLPGIVILAAAFREIKNQPIFQLIIVYMLYMVASSMWSTPFELYKFGQKLANAAYILSFIVLTHFLRTWYQDGFDRMLRFATLFAAVSATITLVIFYNDHPFPHERVRGLGSLTNVNEFSNVYAVYALLAMFYGLQAPLLRQKIFYYCQVAAIISFIWFGQSRTAFVSLSVALLFLVISAGRQDKLRFVVLVLVTVGILAAAFPELVEKAWTRGLGPRPLIWQSYLNDVAQAPIFGLGLITEVSYIIGPENFSTAHNAYIQALFHGGAVGLGLHVLLIFSACWQAWRLGKERGGFLVLSILLLAACTMLSGVDTLVARPRDQWMLVWFPLALLISYQTTNRRAHPSWNQRAEEKTSPCAEESPG